ncbi:FtsW/RodA/SpoVE family cell cycle protein [Isoptericola variabilis]|uniref:Cell cycle protein n=1 Tax=Isoptericola variabilis (strain 225) TaxID=743718 RepID=F6FQ87_ISOV2|nr:FtsW/RodA/SpoVE family cell cycle protein [Isoptericola variabilis]AEG42840.1 cell cycle protein [Isoptericola variabilis 225]TWH30980.1 cell division protein FtsW (lipid II flippase) [Isoptericola variabilis J7]
MSAVAQAPAGRTVEPHERRPLRLAELFLLVLALAAGIGAFAMVGRATTGDLPEGFWITSGMLVGMALVGHVVLHVRAPWADQVILPAVVLLNGLGLATILRLELSGARTMEAANASSNAVYSLLGAVIAFGILWFVRDHRSLRRFTYTAMIVGLLLVMLPLVPGLGQEINGARIWVRLAGMSMQPAEFAKIAFAVFFAGYLVMNRDTLTLAGKKVLGLQLPRVRDLGPILIVWVASLGVLVFERDLGTSLLFFGLFVAMLYLATERFSWVLIGLVLFGTGAFFAASLFPHVGARMDVWLNPFDQALYDRVGGSFQVVQGLFALGAGGLFGTGWGEGYPHRVPFAYSDFIYTSIGEELGLTGLLALLLVYLLVAQRGLRTALAVRDGFGKLLAGGLAFIMALQVFVVVGGITRIIPLTGLTLPFMAQGGSSLLANWIVVALLLRISDSARRPSALPVRGQVAPRGATHEPIVVGPHDEAPGGRPTGTPASGTPLPRRTPAYGGPTEIIDTTRPDAPRGEHP